MNKELIKEWVATLRSDQYRQGRGGLFSLVQQKYCCLGVLCDITKHLVNGSWEADNENTFADFVTPSGKNYSSLQPEVANLLSVRDYSMCGGGKTIDIDKSIVEKYIDIDHEESPTISLTRINDRYQATFNQIADMIEEQFLS